MLKKEPKRFSYPKVVKKGKYKGALHIRTEKYQKFQVEFYCLSDFIDVRIVSLEPEEIRMRNMLVNIQNVLDYEIERCLEYYVKTNTTKKGLNLINRMDNGFVSFKEKFKYLFDKRLISQEVYDILEQIRLVRNSFVHYEPVKRRKKHLYFNKQLMTLESIRRLFKDIRKVRLELLRADGPRKSFTALIPVGFTREMGWTEQI